MQCGSEIHPLSEEKKIEVGAKMIHRRGEGEAGYCLVTPPPPPVKLGLGQG